ncbi:pentaheme c-type cytochrome TorC [Psychrobacter sp. DAB_AL62B]|uniref:pentaheme c-type cytochrome TorC n=1 Tax=Psychrobacter sp. DAB_AL62B TaxID=1028420 RepID=UPI0023812FEB|nr:pentaheme c-type cytochrome TorC [Psychrobacter sp. DAB_AL62B]
MKAIMSAIKSLFNWLRRLLFKPSAKIGLGILIIIGFAGGVWFWAGFNAGMQATNTEEFCTSCHTMGDNMLPELKKTVHFKNRTGVRAECSDCHVPHDFTAKVARKMQASREVLSQLMGDIGTREKFLDHRVVLAQREWGRFKANDSKECRTCHDYDSMDFDKMRVTSQMIMRSAAERDASCLDCHKGIAHELPNTEGMHNPAFDSLLSEARSTKIKDGQNYYNIVPQDLYTSDDRKTKAGSIEIAAPVKVLAHKDGGVQIELDMWRKNKGFGRVWYTNFGLNIPDAVIEKDLASDKSLITAGEAKEDPLTGLEWQKVKAQFWVAEGGLMESIEPAWDIASQTYSDSCSTCHRQPDPSGHDANQWPGLFSGMVGFTNLDNDSAAMVLKYLQLHSSDFRKNPQGSGSPENTFQGARP